MATFAFVHGGGDVGWSWHFVERELRGLGHQTVAPDLPCDNPTASLVDYADAVIDHTLALLATVTTTDDVLAAWAG